MSDAKRRLAALEATRHLKGRRVIVGDPDLLIDRLAGAFGAAAHQRVDEAGVFHVALSGGSTPEALYRRLVIDPRYRFLPWEKMHIWLVDERCVGFEDERSNAKLIKEMIVDHVPMEAGQFHVMPVDRKDGDEIYEQDLRAALANPMNMERLDFVLLGMGADGHTASLFPGSAALREREKWVVYNDGPGVAEPRPRMTMTYPLINGARQIAVLAMGEKKHGAIQMIGLSPEDVGRLPVTGVEPSGEGSALTWYLDYEAALGPGMNEVGSGRGPELPPLELAE